MLKRALKYLVGAAVIVLISTHVSYSREVANQEFLHHLKEIDRLVATGQHKQGIVYAKAIVTDYPERAEGWRSLANAYAVHGMGVYRIGGYRHQASFHSMLDASKEAVRLSDNWVYKEDLADNYLVAIYYGVDVDFLEVITYFRAWPLPDHHNPYLDRSVRFKKSIVERYRAQNRRFFKLTHPVKRTRPPSLLAELLE